MSARREPPARESLSSGWGCPHEDRGECRKLRRDCDPGIPGCVLHGRVRFSNPEKNATPEEAERARRRVAKRRGGASSVRRGSADASESG